MYFLYKLHEEVLSFFVYSKGNTEISTGIGVGYGKVDFGVQKLFISETQQYKTNWTNRKSHTSFRSVPKINDLGRYACSLPVYQRPLYLEVG